MKLAAADSWLQVRLLLHLPATVLIDLLRMLGVLGSITLHEHSPHFHEVDAVARTRAAYKWHGPCGMCRMWNLHRQLDEQFTTVHMCCSSCSKQHSACYWFVPHM